MGLATVMTVLRETGDHATDLGAEEIRRELRRVLESPDFRGSYRCRSFLEFAVTQTLEGNGQNLKERAVAIEVFGRDATANLSEDSIVRVGAREVRKRLAQYYLHGGVDDPIRIELPAGSYVPVFEPNPGASVRPKPAIVPRPAPAASVPLPRRRLILWAAALATVALIISGIAAWRWWRAAPTSVAEDFWQPALAQSGPVIVALAHPIVYHPSGTPPSPGQPERSDLRAASDQYVGFGDTEALLRLSGFLAARSRNVRVRLASKLDFSDLRDSAAILIGGASNRWTAELTANFRYRFGSDDQRRPCVVDATIGACRWTLHQSAAGQASEDYILISRIPRSQTGRLLVAGAGLSQSGTQEMGRILADSDALTPLLRQLPEDWPQRNVQLVLHSHVVGDAPTTPELVSWHSW